MRNHEETYDQGGDHIKEDNSSDPEPRGRPIIVDANSTHYGDGVVGVGVRWRKE